METSNNLVPNDHWSKLDNTVYRKLHIENTITERLHFLEKKIFS